MPYLNGFQYKISNQMIYQRTFYDNVENMRKLKFQLKVEIGIRGVWGLKKINIFKKN